MPERIFRTLYPEADGFKCLSPGPVEHDIEYTEILENGEEVTVTIPWESTRFYMVRRPNLLPQCFALYAMPPAVASSKTENAGLPWGRGQNHAAMDAAERALEAHIKEMQDVGYKGKRLFMGVLDDCITMAIIGWEVSWGTDIQDGDGFTMWREMSDGRDE